MLVVISPAKTLDFESTTPTTQFTQCELLDESLLLIKQCQQLSMQDIASLMKVSDKIAGLNVARFTQWSQPFSLNNAKQAIFAFQGDVYTGFDINSLPKKVLDYAQTHLRILSGLYGVLKPLDLMQAYRLEMGTRLKNERGTNLYQFWGEIITATLNKTLKDQETKQLINLASNEYFKSVNQKTLNAQIITPIFKDQKNGKYKIISFYAKKARGLMARYIMENKVKNIDQLKAFDANGYYFVEGASNSTTLMFYRNEI
ncbi:MAG: peroxide stress protein YaaA [Psychromonas sp.]|nr:peroxide stress protein YaaA [Psychromonas sp.]